MVTRVEKVTVSLPRDLVSLTDKIAKEKRTSRSKIISGCLRELAEKQMRAEMAEGYKTIAQEQKKIADLTFELQSQVVPEWK